MKIKPSRRFTTVPKLITACNSALDAENLDYASYTYLHDLIPALCALEEDFEDLRKQMHELENQMTNIVKTHAALKARFATKTA